MPRSKNRIIKTSIHLPSRTQLSWDAVAGVTDYKLYNGATEIYDGTADSYSRTGLFDDTEYTTVAASAATGDSEKSAEVTAKTPKLEYRLPSPSGSAQLFTNNGDGTITDVNTQFMWEKLADASDHVTASQSAVITACTTRNTGGHNDWRLPTADELYMIATSVATIRL